MVFPAASVTDLTLPVFPVPDAKYAVVDCPVLGSVSDVRLPKASYPYVYVRFWVVVCEVRSPLTVTLTASTLESGTSVVWVTVFGF